MSSLVTSKRHEKTCVAPWKMPNRPIASITFDSALLLGHFALYDNLHGSGTQIAGFFKKGLGKNRWLPPNYSYKFVAYMRSTCDNLTDNVYFQTDVTFNFLPKKRGFINEEGGMDKVIKTTMFSWYWGPKIKIAIVAFENHSSNVRRRESWEEISCADVITLKKALTLSNILGDDAIDDDD
ncbi:15004_t:CDS:2 [Funneliformis mosseae]|uniref:15004_t:CDS:1 n=1 Tax=Funneliformis mosseae TaxID=27381 RepID=A0A9N8ZJ85_FUNMO|nr:15004_t:CDS:2 [Funneliformis mosseae]